MSEDVFQKHREMVFALVKEYGIKNKGILVEEINKRLTIPGEQVTEKDLRKHERRGEFENLWGEDITLIPREISETPRDDIKMTSQMTSDPQIGEILTRLSRVEKRLSELDSFRSERGFPTLDNKKWEGETRSLTVRLPSSLYDELKSLSNRSGESMNSLISQMISRMISTT
jgi:predicted HicB family RNase H-like nuclease